MDNLSFGRDQLQQAEASISESLSHPSVSAKMTELLKSYNEGGPAFREALALAALTRLALAARV